jgi:hypothetical protein
VNRKKKKPNSNEPQEVNKSENLKQPDTENNIEERLYETLNTIELKKSMDKWLKSPEGKNSVMMRDLTILRGVNEEYLNSFIVLGYTLDDERVIIQSYRNPKDKDALMEFLKNVFIQQCNQNLSDNS